MDSNSSNMTESNSLTESTTPTTTKNKNSSLIVVLLIVIAVLLGIIMFLLFRNNSTDENRLDEQNSTDKDAVDNTDSNIKDSETEDSNEEINEEIEVDNSVNETKTFNSSTYNVKFNYPTSLGNATVTSYPEYFNNEGVGFSNSPISLTYWHAEGSAGGSIVSTESITTKDNKTCTLNTLKNNEEQYTLSARCPDESLGAYIVLTALNLKSEAEVELTKSDLKQIVNSLEYSR